MTGSPSTLPPSATVDWRTIDTVLLDLDGTLLDLYFDNHFWLEHLPRRYAEHQAISLDEARAYLYARFTGLQGTMQWYCLDFWARELALDIVALKREVQHLIRTRPNAVRFLEALRAAGKQVVLATNAHPGSLGLKMHLTALDRYFDAIYSAHDFAVPKEEAGFWKLLQASHGFDPACTLFVDDNEAVLAAARDYGIARVLGISQPDSRRAAQAHDEFVLLSDFDQLLPVA